MSLARFDREATRSLVTTIRNAGVAGAGGAGFPTHAKWQRLDDVDHLLVNHQESEPIYYADRWLGRERAAAFADLFDALLETALETVVVAPKLKDREWVVPLEEATDATVYLPGDLPIDPDAESGVVVAYTDAEYQYGMESVLLRIVDDTIVTGDELPMDRGWLVQNTETLANIYRALEHDEPVTRTYLHVDGNAPTHGCYEVPVGTPAETVLDAAGRPIASLSDAEVLLEGGPGWCFHTDGPPETVSVSKRTNGLLVMERYTVSANTLGDGRIDLLDARDWTGDHATTPTPLDVSRVRVPLVANPAFGIVSASDPVVSPGERVETGEVIATPSEEGISNTQHASIDGVVTDVGEAYVEIRTEGSTIT
jgi:Na+-translocating ferredoxin:NAD+ oxidoreductase RnfC subunit